MRPRLATLAVDRRGGTKRIFTRVGLVHGRGCGGSCHFGRGGHLGFDGLFDKYGHFISGGQLGMDGLFGRSGHFWFNNDGAIVAVVGGGSDSSSDSGGVGGSDGGGSVRGATGLLPIRGLLPLGRARSALLCCTAPPPLPRHVEEYQQVAAPRARQADD